MNLRSRLSLLVIQIFILTLMAALLGRLFYLQVAAAPRYRDAALSIQSRDVINPAPRGLIVDSSGVPLALNRVGLAITVNRIVIDRLPDKGNSVLARVSNLLGLNFADVYRKTRLCGELPKYQKQGCWTGSRYQPIPITKEATPDLALQVVERSDQYPGIDATPMAIRTYPALEGAQGAHVLGYVGPVTEEDLAKNKNYYRSESIGKTGLEIQYDSYLRGIPGIRTVIVDRKESVTKVSQNTQPIPGEHVVTSLDVRVQGAAEKALADAVRRARASGNRADSGAAVVMDIHTGQIIALASYPSFDTNAWEKGLTAKQARDLFSEKTGVPALSRPLQGLFAPASTFKAISVFAAADAGYNLNGVYDCPAQTMVGNRAFKNSDSKPMGRISLKRGIAASCDTLWYQIAFDEWLRDGGLKPKSNTSDFFYNAARQFKLDEKTGIDLPSELTGRLPDRQWRKDWYDANKNYYCNYKDVAPAKQQTKFLIELARENCIDGDKVRAGDAVNFSIGQGDTLVTPLKLTQMYAAIANGGTLWKTTVAKAIVKTNGSVVRTFKPEVLGRVEADRSTFNFLNASLRAVVTEGTAAGAFAGFPVAVSGKTGTAQVFGRNWDGSAKDNTSWFASYGPTEKPRFAVVMMVSQGGYGASAAGVGVRKIYETLFGVRGGRVVPSEVVFPSGKPPTKLPKISPATKVKKATP